MKWYIIIGIISFLLINTAWKVDGIVYKLERKQRNVNANNIEDWEAGLREATHQALARENHLGPNFSNHIANAPLIGRKHTATPFGDIAILARGQLYVTSTGFQFVQDPYQNDCDDCHNRCGTSQCEIWSSHGRAQLIALWSVKRIRHRDDAYGHRFELEYTVSPVSEALRKGFITRNGRFDYTIPGHVFVIRSNSKYVTGGIPTNHYQQPKDENKWYNQQVPNQYNIYSSQDQDLPSYVPIQHHQHTYSTRGLQPPYGDFPQSTNNPKEVELYKLLIESLASKTSTTNQISPNTPHRFMLGSTRPISRIPPYTTGTQPTTRIIYQPTTKIIYQPTQPHVFASPTLVQFPTSQFTPITEETNPFSLPSATRDEHASFIQTQPNIGSVSSEFEHSRPHTSQITSTLPTTINVGITESKPKPTLHYFSPIEDEDNSKNLNKTFTITTQSIATPIPVQSTIKTSQTFQSTISNKTATTTRTPSTTKPMSTQSNFKTSRRFGSTKRYTSFKNSRKPSKATRPKTTKSSINGEDDSDYNIFPEIVPTEAMKLETKTPPETYPSSINAQLPPPHNEKDTTIPYVSSTTVLATRQNTLSYTKVTKRPTTSHYVPGKLSTTRQTKDKNKTRTPLVRFTYKQRNKTRDDTTTSAEVYRSTTPVSDSGFEDSTRTMSTKYNEVLNTQSTFPNYDTSGSVPPEIASEKLSTTRNEMVPSTTDYNQTPANFISSASTTFEQGPTTHTFYSYAPEDGDKTTSSIETTSFQDPYSNSDSSEMPNTTTLQTTKAMSYSNDPTIKHTTMSYIPSELTITTELITTPISSSPTLNIHYIPPTKSNIKTTKLYPITRNDFLVDNSSGVSQIQSNQKDYNEDDIFGPKPMRTTSATAPHNLVTKQIENADILNALFDKYENHSQEKSELIINTTELPAKIIYSDFFEASTLNPTKSQTQLQKIMQKDHTPNSENENHHLTSQSYITSISYKVNKNNKIKTSDLQSVSTIKEDLIEVLHDSDNSKVYNEIPSTPEVTTEASEKETSKIFDNIALQLVNHARSIDYLNMKKRTPKYRRKAYSPTRKNSM